MDLWLLYLIAVLPGIGEAAAYVAVLVGALCLLGAAVAIAGFIENAEKLQAVSRHVLRWSLPAFGSLILIQVAVPSAQELHWIIGGYFVTNIEGVQDLPPNIVETLNVFLESLKDTVGTSK